MISLLLRTMLREQGDNLGGWDRILKYRSGKLKNMVFYQGRHWGITLRSLIKANPDTLYTGKTVRNA